MEYDARYKTNHFVALGKSSNNKEKNKQSTNTMDAFEYYSGINLIYAEYNYYHQAYTDTISKIEYFNDKQEYFSDYIEVLKKKKLEYFWKMIELNEKLQELEKIQKDITDGKQLLIIKGNH